MWHKTIILFFCFFGVSEAIEPNERLEPLSCEGFTDLKLDSLYPIQIKKLSSFYLGKKESEEIFQLDFEIDPNFFFPKKNTDKNVIPFFSEKKTISCYMDYLPISMPYLYEHGKTINDKIQVYIHKEPYFKIDVFIQN